MDEASPVESTLHDGSTDSPLSRTAPLSERQKNKARAIRRACLAGDRRALIQEAIDLEGLVSDDVRREAWPFLLGFDGASSPPGSDDDLSEKHSGRQRWQELPPHEDEGQVKLDVNRSFIYYPTNLSPRQLDERKRELSDLIVEVLRRHPTLGYFQGFHDICQVILLVLGPEMAVPAVERVALLRIRDFMLPSMEPALDHLHLLYPLLNAANPKLCAHLSRTQPFFALAATLTLYAHDIQEYSNIARLFDVFLAMDPVFPVYLFAQIVMDRKEELFEIPDDEPEMLHSILSKLPKPLDLEGWISRAIGLLEEHPPEKLSTWRYVSRLSVLKTSHKSDPRKLSLTAAEQIVRRHSRELERTKRRKELLKKMVKHKRPMIIGLSIFVGISSIILGLYARNHSGTSMEAIPGLSTFFRVMVAIQRLF